MSYNKTIFQGVPKKNVNKSRFNLSHEYKAGLTMGRLIPILTLETLPGDEFNIDTEFMFRFAPMYFPIMHKVTMRADYFFIPNRILWTGSGEGTDTANYGWKEWIAGYEDAGGLGHPVFTSEQANDLDKIQNVVTYMGVPVGIEDPGITTTTIQLLNAFPLSAYLKIWDEYYRIPQLEDERWFNLASGINDTAFEAAFGNTGGDYAYKPLSAKWEKDYFTSALPTPQIGDAIQIPMVGDNLDFYAGTEADGPFRWRKVSDDLPASGAISASASGTPSGRSVATITDSYLDIQETAATIKQLRIAEVLQSYYERIMKVGQRYRDFIEGLWGNDPEPNTVDVPVLLGSKFGRVQISDVMTQALTVPDAGPQSRTGDYTGQANLYSNDGGNINYRCHEHGWIMCIFQMNPNTSYGQGIERFWRRSVQTDYPLDMFAGIGDQEILKEEVLWNFQTAGQSLNDDTFGYIPRFSEMRFKNNMQIGVLNYNTGLSTHMGRVFDPGLQNPAQYPVLEINSEFVNSQPGPYGEPNAIGGGIRLVDTFRVLPIDDTAPDESSEPVIFGHIFHSIYVNRNLPMFSTPKSI